MIETFKILNNFYNSNCVPHLQLHEGYSTRGSSLKLKPGSFRTDMGKYSFSNRIVKIWNTLPEDVVTAESVNSFKCKLDACWNGCELLFDFKAVFPGLLYNYQHALLYDFLMKSA